VSSLLGGERPALWCHACVARVDLEEHGGRPAGLLRLRPGLGEVGQPDDERGEQCDADDDDGGDTRRARL
jgi:hypothetical protein